MNDVKTPRPLALFASDAPVRGRSVNVPPAMVAVCQGREKRPLGELFGLGNFGVNLTTVAPGAVSALHHGHSLQEEFVYVLEGEVTLVTDQGEMALPAGACAGFAAGRGTHHLENRSTEPAIYLEVGDRTVGDQVSYPFDDIAATYGQDCRWVYRHKDGSPYQT